MEGCIGLIISIIFWSLIIAFAFFTGKGTRKDWYCFERFFHYSGLKFIWAMFIPNKKGVLPTGFVWLTGLYFAAYAFTSQRYESQLDNVEFRYNTFTTQVAAGATFSNHRLMEILNKEIPVKPSIDNPFKVFQSFVYGPYSERYYQTYKDDKNEPFKNAEAFRQIIIKQWDRKLAGADFSGAKFTKAVFSKAQLKEANFMEARFEEVNFANAQLEKAIFLWAQLGKANFAGARLDGANFYKAQLKKAIFWNTRVEGVKFNQAQLERATFYKSEGLKPEQLIRARDLCGIKIYSKTVLRKIREYGCDEMLTKHPDEWSKEFIKHRRQLLKQWEKH